MKYLPVVVYKNSLGDCTANGISETHCNKLVVPHEDGFMSYEQVQENDFIILELEVKNVGPEPYYCFKQLNDTRWLMNGGNFVYSSDSRFKQKYGNQPIAIHDRCEG